MNSLSAVAAQVKRTRRTAKFIHVSHSHDWIDPAADLGAGFYIANLYDERIDANMITGKFGRAMVQNTYISSFAYNMFLCWLYANRSKAIQAPPPTTDLDTLLAHNFKKFVAEQLYCATNQVRSRALLLETLLFEQKVMVPLFAAKGNEAKLSADADWGADLMSFALSMHELGHFYLSTKPAMWDAIVEEEPDAIGSVFGRIAGAEPPEFVAEFQCDAYAIIGCLQQYADYGGAELALRGIVFAYAAYAAMYSAAATARATDELWAKIPEPTVDFRSIEPMPPVEHEVSWARDGEFIKRARLVAEVCGKLAERRGVRLFSDHGTLALPANIVERLLGYVDRVFYCADENARRMSNLMAQALSGHDDGMEYLYLRSKVFRTNRTEPLVVRSA